jgi:hypothetical protein
MVPWLIASGALVSFILLWLRTTQRELLPLWEGVQGQKSRCVCMGDLLGQSQEDLRKNLYGRTLRFMLLYVCITSKAL